MVGYTQTIEGRDLEHIIYPTQMPATEQFVAAARARWMEADRSDFEPFEDYWRDRATDRLHTQVQGCPLLGHELTFSTPTSEPDPVDVFFILDGAIIALQAVGTTRRELLEERARVEVEREQEQARAAEQRRRRLDSSPRRTIMLSDLTGKELPSPKAAATFLTVELRGKIAVRNNTLVFTVPEVLAEPGGWGGVADAEQRLREQAHDAVRVLLACREHVLAAFSRHGLDIGKLSDEPVGADGCAP
jgi:hypothetical protein